MCGTIGCKRFNARRNIFLGNWRDVEAVTGHGNWWVQRRMGGLWGSEQDTVHDDEGDREVDHKAGDVNESGDEGGGGGGRVRAELLEHDGEHAAGNGAPEHDPDEGDADS